MQYRFAIVVWVDQSEERHIVELSRDKNSKEFSLLSGLAETMTIFSIIGPAGPSKNIAFAP